MSYRRDYFFDDEAPKANSIKVATSAVVTNKEGMILLHRRRDNDMWSLPGGVMETGETIEDCVRREVKEETGVEVTINRLIGIYSNPSHIIEFKDGEIRQEFSMCFHCTIKEPFEINVSEESREVKFFNIDEIEELDIHRSQKLRISDYKSNTGVQVR